MDKIVPEYTAHKNYVSLDGMQATVEDYDSDMDADHSHSSTRQANTDAKGSDRGPVMPPPSIVSHRDHGNFPISRRASVSSKRLPAEQGRATLTRGAEDRKLPDIEWLTCGPNADFPYRRRGPDTPPPYPPQSSAYTRQPTPYTRGPVVVQTARTRRTSLAARPQSQSYNYNSGAILGPPHMPAPYLSLSQQVPWGPPPSYSAYLNSQYPPEPHYYQSGYPAIGNARPSYLRGGTSRASASESENSSSRSSNGSSVYSGFSSRSSNPSSVYSESSERSSRLAPVITQEGSDLSKAQSRVPPKPMEHTRNGISSRSRRRRYLNEYGISETDSSQGEEEGGVYRGRTRGSSSRPPIITQARGDEPLQYSARYAPQASRLLRYEEVESSETETSEEEETLFDNYDVREERRRSHALVPPPRITRSQSQQPQGQRRAPMSHAKTTPAAERSAIQRPTRRGRLRRSIVIADSLPTEETQRKLHESNTAPTPMSPSKIVVQNPNPMAKTKVEETHIDATLHHNEGNFRNGKEHNVTSSGDTSATDNILGDGKNSRSSGFVPGSGHHIRTSGDHRKVAPDLTESPKRSELDEHSRLEGSLYEPTQKNPQPVLKGVMPQKTALPGKDVPDDARFTRIDRQLVNPEALGQAKERFVERMDSINVSRGSSREEYQKLADSTMEVREQRGVLCDAAKYAGVANSSTENEHDTHKTKDHECGASLKDPVLDTESAEVTASDGLVDFPILSTEQSIEAQTYQHFHDDNDETTSISSSYAASVASIFSLNSLASSVSDLSTASKYSAIQIATATKELVIIFHEDEVLTPLYDSALENPAIGAEKLLRNLRRIFQAYAKHLYEEATDRLEYHAARLVAMKARWLAESIVEKFQPRTQAYCRPEAGESSDDEPDARLVIEEEFEDLVVFRDFLVGSEAFKVLRTQVRSFVLLKLPEPPRATQLQDTEEHGKACRTVESHEDSSMQKISPLRSWRSWRRDVAETADAYFRNSHWPSVPTALFHISLDAIFLTTDGLLTATGQLEPPLQQGKVRLRWSCQRGDALFSDVQELREGGIVDLISHMQSSSRVQVTATTYSPNSSNQQYVVPRPGRWIRNGFAKVTAVFGNALSKSPQSLPQHTNTCASTTSSQTTISQPLMLHLLACMHHNRLRKFLQQDRIESIKTDRALLCFMRQQYVRHRGRFLNLLSLKTVQGIYFVKFRLPIGGSVDVRHHNPCCITPSSAELSACQCIPPKTKVEPSPSAEYRCIPGPPATYPPVPPEYLKSLFTCPTDVHEQDTWILDQLPKRICGELQGKAGLPADGWGIYYQEGLDVDVIIFFVFVVFLLASLLFGVLWSRFQFDVQGAFGVSAYMVTASGILVTLLASRVEKRG